MLGIIHRDRDGAPAFVFDMMEPERRKVDRASGLRRFAEIAVFDPVAHTSRTGTTSSPAPTAEARAPGEGYSATILRLAKQEVVTV
jgi:hypothetical protein